jgi:hypothetical protein
LAIASSAAEMQLPAEAECYQHLYGAECAKLTQETYSVIVVLRWQ